MQLVEVTTRWHEGEFSGALIVSESRKGPSAWESGDSEMIFFFFPGGSPSHW